VGCVVRKDKAFGQGEFNTQALLHQLKDSDLGKPLEEVRDAFWNTPGSPCSSPVSPNSGQQFTGQ